MRDERERFMRVMALDIGEVRTGVAISDPDQRVASPITVLASQDVYDCTQPFKKVLDEWEPELLVCGMPKSLSGKEGRQAERIRKAADTITLTSGIPHVFADERLSSREAKQSMRELGYDEKSMRGKVDMVAAGLFLQSYLDGQAAK